MICSPLKGTLLAALILPASTLSGAITVNVYRDYNGNALDDGGNEPGVSGLTLTAYDAAGSATAATDNGGGSYTIPTSAGAYRVELTNLPDYLQPGATGAGSKPSVTFASDGAALSMAVQNPAQHTQANPRIAVACYEGGTGAGSTGPALVSFPYNSDGIPSAFSPNPPNGTAASPRKDAQIQELGTVWGAAWQPEQERLFQSSFLKRHVGFADGPGYVYVIDYSGGTATVTGKFNLHGLSPANGGANINVGSVTRTSVPGSVSGDHELSDDPTKASWDLDAFGKVAAISFGDAELTEDGRHLWIVNTNQKALIELDATPATGSLPGTVNQHVISSLPGAPTSTTGQVRPWALKFHDGLGYLGVVLDASTSKSASDLEAIVLSFDPGNIASGFTEVLRFGLDYNRENGQSTGGGVPHSHLQWQFWASSWVEAAPFTNGTDNNYMAPQPILADIEITEDGSMVIGMMDRFGHMNGRTNYQAISGNTGLFDTNSGGDLLHACLVNGSFVIEGAPGCPTSDNNDDSGPASNELRQDDGASNNGEYYHEDHFEEGSPASYTHGETATGALTLLLGTAEVVTTHYDPIQGTSVSETVTNTQGVVWHDTLLGTRAQISGGEHSYMIVPRSPVDSSGFAKSNGLGDLELLLAPPPLEIGDFVWHDSDKDGVQDPGEPGLNGVTVNLYDLDAGGTHIGSAVTGSGGAYLFGGAGDAGMTSGSLLTNRNYELRIALSDPGLGGKVPTITAGGTTLNDSDGVQTGNNVVITHTTGAVGANDHSLDFGFADVAVAIGNLVFCDDNNNGLRDGGEAGINGVTVELLRDANNDGDLDDPGESIPVATATTAGGGFYGFDLALAGNYQVVIPSSNFGGVLASKTLSSTITDTNDNGEDNDDNGTQAGGPGTVVTSPLIALAVGDEPGSGGSLNTDDTIDFGFVDPVSLLSLGDLVFCDDDNDGEFELLDGETGVNGVTLDLYRDANNDGDLDDPGESTVIATTTTSGGGLYSFANLAPGNYQIVIPASNFSGALSSKALSSTNTDPVDNQENDDDNGSQPGGAGTVVSSPMINLAHFEEPGLDGDPTVDFGFVDPGTLVGVGNLVYIDENGNDVYDDGTDTPVEGAVVELYLPGGDGAPGGGDDAIVAVTTTGTSSGGSAGCYSFLNLPPDDYFVKIPASEFAGGKPLYRAITLSGEGGDTGIDGTSDDNSDENGRDGSSHTANGAISGVISLAVGTEPTDVQESGKDGAGDDAYDANIDYTVDFGFSIAKAQLYADYLSDTGLTPGTSGGQPVADASGNGGNPDGDIHDNLLEHAVCDTPNSGVPNHPAFCAELSDPDNGIVDVMFVRPEGIKDVIYTLAGYNTLGGTPTTIAIIPAGDAASFPFTVSSNGDGTETVTYPNIRVASAFTDPDFGLVELCVSLDADQNGTPDTVTLPSDGSSVTATSCTKLFGWNCTDYNAAQCASWSSPFANKPDFSGTIDFNTGGTLDVSTSANGADLGTIITAAGTHYLQVTSGAHEGERFDISSAGVDSLTLVNDPQIFATADAVESLNTSDGVPADSALDSATFEVIPHRTIDQLFDKNSVFSSVASGTPSTAAKILTYDNRTETPGFVNYILIDNGSEVKWIRTNDLLNQVDQGSVRIDCTEGVYLHPMLDGLTACSVGMVADHDLAAAFNSGYNLAGAPYPIDQAPADADPGPSTEGRNMQVSTGFIGGVTPTAGSQLFFWSGDMAVDDGMAYMTGYESLMLLDGGGMQRWIDATDPSITDVGGQLTLLSHRAVTVKLVTGDTKKPHRYPQPGQ